MPLPTAQFDRGSGRTTELAQRSTVIPVYGTRADSGQLAAVVPDAAAELRGSSMDFRLALKRLLRGRDWSWMTSFPGGAAAAYF